MIDPENTKTNRLRIRREIQNSTRGTQISINVYNALVDVVVAECTALRSRIANQIIEPLVGRYEDGLDNDRLEKLAFIVLNHSETPDGIILLNEPEEKPPSLRLI